MAFHSPPSNPPNSVSEGVTVFLQPSCLQHRYIRNKDTSNVVERPERLRAISVGVAAIKARLDVQVQTPAPDQDATPRGEQADGDDLVAAITKLTLSSTSTSSASNSSIKITQSNASISILNHPATKFIHGDIDGDVYLEDLIKWSKESVEAIASGGSEIPGGRGLAQGDLYLCPTSLDAIQGALGTVCEAVDQVFAPSSSSSPGAPGTSQLPQEVEPNHTIKRAFVGIRPPGHHCGEDTPSGFCFVNNVAVAAAHAHLKYGVKKIVIFDIDLHHGNGTQAIAWQINEETYRQTLESEGGSPKAATGPHVFYGSIHDILSYPCEDGKPALVQAASVSLHGAHGQHIENVHLGVYETEEDFWVLYESQYRGVLRRAEEFLQKKLPGEALIFMSTGFDASEHEYPSMSRHNRKVPTGFYYRFTRDILALADIYAKGRVISVLEGGYSDRALISGVMAHLGGMVDGPSQSNSDGTATTQPLVDQKWWSPRELDKLEAITAPPKKKRGGRASGGTGTSSLNSSASSATSTSTSTSAQPNPPTESDNQWIDQMFAVLAPLETWVPLSPVKIPEVKSSAVAKTMTLRDRSGPRRGAQPPAALPPIKSEEGGDSEGAGKVPTKKLPRVILKVGKPPPVPPGPTES